jgi:oxaloacetate decarboxylase alpha subunit
MRSLLAQKENSPLNIREIKELIKTLTDTDIAEFVYETEGTKLAIRKQAAFAPIATAQDASAVPNIPVAQRGVLPETPKPATVATQEAENNVTIVAPMVGTFYRASSPDAAPYVSVGDEVEVGQPLCIIEAMKLMNEIESEVKGRVVSILAENAQPVEYGQPLFVIETY